MDEERVTALAKEAVAQFIETWDGCPSHTQLIKREDVYFLVVRTDSPLEAAQANGAELYINLEEKCKYSIRRYCEDDPDAKIEDAELERYATQSMVGELKHSIALLPDLFQEFLHLLEIVTLHRRSKAAFGPLSEDMQRQCVDMAEEWFQIMLKHRGLVKETRPGVATTLPDDKVMQALLNIRTMSPSRHRLAKELGTTRATVRALLRRKGVDSPAELMSSLINGLKGEQEGGAEEEGLCESCKRSATGRAGNESAPNPTPAGIEG